MRQRPVALTFLLLNLCILGHICCHRLVQLFFVELVSFILSRTGRLFLEFLSSLTVFVLSNCSIFNLLFDLNTSFRNHSISGPTCSLSSSVSDELDLLLLQDEDTDDDEGTT